MLRQPADEDIYEHIYLQIRKNLKEPKIAVAIIDEFIANFNKDIHSGILHKILGCAVYLNQIKRVEKLLELGANPNEIDDLGMTAISYTSNPDIRKILIEKGAKEIGSHSQIIELMIALGYGNNFHRDGVCHGLADVFTDYILRGKQGISDLNKLLAVIGKQKDPKKLVSDIQDAEKKRLKITNTHKESIKKRLQSLPLQEIFDEVNKLDSNKVRELINDVLKSNFTDTTQEQRTECINNILQNPSHITLEVKSFKNAKKISIREEILNAQINFLVQKELNALVKETLKDDVILLELPNFLQCIAIAHNPENHKQLFAENIAKIIQPNLVASFSLINSPQSEKLGLAIPKTTEDKISDNVGFFATYTKSELYNTLLLLEEPEFGFFNPQVNIYQITII